MPIKPDGGLALLGSEHLISRNSSSLTNSTTNSKKKKSNNNNKTNKNTFTYVDRNGLLLNNQDLLGDSSENGDYSDAAAAAAAATATTGSSNSTANPVPPRPTKNNSNLTSVDKIEGGEQQITVACRIRPLTEEEILEGSTLIGHKIADDNMIVLMDPLEDEHDILRHNRSREKQFVFDMVVDARTGQQEVFEKTTKDLLPSVLNGYNATVFAYGATGAGKTYTMLGTREEPGIMFRTLHHLFIEIERSSSDMTYQVSMSYLEIYNELIRDLLSPSSGFLELREDAKGGISVAGISEVVAETPEEVMYMLHKGNKERTQEPTKANKTSSRSHAVLQVNIKQRNKVRTHSHEIRLGKLYMIDLAGSERAAQTQNTGKRMVEGAHINRSLLALGNCINALSEKGSSKYVNYRDSKLTRILKDSLGGNSKTVMIAHISPASIHFEESRNTLTYADRAKYIRTKLRRNVIDVSYHISQYQQIIQELAQEIAVLKEQKYDLESRVSHPTTDSKMSALMLPGNNGMNSNNSSSSLEETLKLRESLLQSFKQQIKLRKNMLDLENAIMDINIEAERHTKIIENWNHHGGQNHISSPTNGDSNTTTAETVANAREELKVVEHDRDELEQKRSQTLRDLELCRAKTRKLRDAASKKLTNSEQKEILGLLLKNFEFEMKNIEMQAELFKRDFKLREQDMVILRLEQHRSLCDTLISQQRKLIVDNNISLPSDLDELYQFYTRDTAEGQLVKDLSSLRSNSQVSINLSPTQPATTTTTANNNNNNSQATTTHSTFLTQIQEENYNSQAGSITPAAMAKGANKKQQQGKQNIYFLNNNTRDTTTTTPTLSPHLSQANKHHKNNLSNLSSSSNDTEIIMEGKPSPARNLTAIRSTSHSNGGGANAGIVAPVIQPGQVVPTGVTQPVEAKRHTQSIAAIAAQRRANKHHRELMQDIFEHSSYSSDSNQQQQQHHANSNNNNSNLKNFHSDSFVLTSSRMNNNNGVDEYNRFALEKKNSVLTDGSLPANNNSNNNSKIKKQVKIRDVVQFKLPDDNHYTEEMGNSYSPIGTYRLDDVNKPRERKSNKQSKASNRSRSQNSHNQNYANQLSPVRPVQGAGSLAVSGNNSVSLNNLYHQQQQQQQSNSNRDNNKAAKVGGNGGGGGSIPNYMKGVNISIAGTSMLKN